MRIETEEVLASELEPGDLYVTMVDASLGQLMADARSDNLRSIGVQVRLEGPWRAFQAKARVTRLRVILEEGDAGYGINGSARRPTKPGEGARRKYWALHGEMLWPDHSKPGDLMEARKDINYRAWSEVLGRRVTSGSELSPDDWGRLATWADRVHEGELQEPSELGRYREGTHPIALGLNVGAYS